jgi:sodium/potassium-transporting ATPase subunit alpha
VAVISYQLPQGELFKAYKTSEDGLGEPEAKKRLKEFGPNTLHEGEKKSYLRAYLSQYTQFFALLLEIAALLSFVAHHYVPGQGSDILGYAILCAVVINATFSFWQEYKADRAMEALLRLMPTMVSVRRNAKTRQIDSRELVPGDVILLEEGDKVAADAVILRNNSLYLNMAALNGESRPSRREETSSHAARALEARNMVFAGTTAVSGSAEALVTATGGATEFGRIAGLTKNVQKALTPMQKEIIRITHILTVIALLMGAVFFALGLFSGKGFLIASIFALSLIVANVPEGMLPTITLALSMASQRMAQRNALIKNLDSVQTLGSASVICTDKTGTLTRNEMTLKEIYLTGGELVTLSGEGYFEGGEISVSKGSDTSKGRLDAFLAAGALNSRAVIEEDTVRGDPTELALVAAARKRAAVPEGYEKLRENPFTSERRMMSTLVSFRGEERLFVKGAPEVILEKTTHLLDRDGTEKKLDDSSLERIELQLLAFEEKAYRVLAIAQASGRSEENLTLLGLAAIMDMPRPEAMEAIATCHRAGIRVMMITGDNPHTAEAVAGLIGLEYEKVMTGEEVERLSDEELEAILGQGMLFSRMASGQKLRITTALQNRGEVVAMTGDGVNDAPALKKADIGVAMGLSGTEVAKEAADMVLLDDNFSSIVSAIEEGRAVYFNIKKFVTYILSSNVPEIVPYILQFFLKIPLPLSVIQILSIDLGSDMLPGLALGSERPEKNLMNRPPVGRDEKILDWEVFKRGYFFIGIIEAAAAMVAFISFLLLHGWHYGEVSLADADLHRQAMTMTLLGAISCQLLNVWTMRSWDFPAWSVGIASNPLLLAAMAVEVIWIWMLLHIGPVQKVFNTASVALSDLWILLPFPVLLFVAHEFYKWWKRRSLPLAEEMAPPGPALASPGGKNP